MTPERGCGAAAVPRVLIVHNAYRLRGGEDVVVQAEEDLLRRHGHAVLCYTRHNDEIDASSRMRLLCDTIWSPRTSRDIARLVADFRPDVIHAHNTLPLISPSLYWAAARAGVPVVQTLHNFRLVCPQAMLLRDGRVCEDCVGHVPWRAVVHRCYRGSAVQSAAVAIAVEGHRVAGTWRDKVALYIALNDFCKARFVAGGLPAERIRIKPHFVDLPAPAPADRHGFLFVGRLATEKGLGVLADAVRLQTPAEPVRVAGSGPERARLEGLLGVELLGHLPAAAVHAAMARAGALLLPSICSETSPVALVEAYASGLPVIASRIGALATLVQDGRTGLLFEAGNAQDLARTLAWASAHPQALREMGAAARHYYESALTGDVNHRCLIGIYAEAMAAARQRRTPAAPAH